MIQGADGRHARLTEGADADYPHSRASSPGPLRIGGAKNHERGAAQRCSQVGGASVVGDNRAAAAQEGGEVVQVGASCQVDTVAGGGT